MHVSVQSHFNETMFDPYSGIYWGRKNNVIVEKKVKVSQTKIAELGAW
jgi:hypothetical protein